MTIDRITLHDLLEKGSDADLLRAMIGFVAKRLMAAEVEGLCGAAHGERAAGRTNHRNGVTSRWSDPLTLDREVSGDWA